MTVRRWFTLVAALIFLGVHLAFLPRTLEDIDSINFAMGVESFDVTAHQPHPPGYPLYIAAAKASTTAVGLARPDWKRDRRAAVGLALWGILAMTLAWFILPRLWELVGLAPWPAWWATCLALTSPLAWLTTSRPLSDAPGLVAALAVQVLLLDGLRRMGSGPPRSTAWLAGAFGAGLVIGIRSQTMWLTAPFVCWGLLRLIRERRRAEALATVAAAAVGTAVWFLPMVVLTRGLGAYLDALASQGAEDFAGVEMLARGFTAPLLEVALSQTFAAPWHMRTLGHVMIGLSLIGVVRLAMRARAVLTVTLLGFLPYGLFHLAFHETVTVRYALPVVVPMAGLAVAALAGLPSRVMAWSAAAISIASLSVVAPLLASYSKEGAPVFTAFEAMQQASEADSAPPTVMMHHQVWWGVRRVLDWYRPAWDVGPQPFPGDREWLNVVEHFRAGDVRPVWFLGHLPRTDMAAFDGRTTRRAGRYVMDPTLRTLMGGARVDSVAWWTIDRPFWMLGRGWALTPELAGMTAQDRANGMLASTRAFLSRHSGSTRLMIGGRYLSADSAGPVDIVASVDGRTVGTWRAAADSRWFVRWLDVAPGGLEGSGAYAVLDLRVSAVSGGPAALVGFEQFDAAPQEGFVYALTDGWHEHEEDPSRDLSWRWTTGRSVIEVRGGEGDRTLRFSGESPLKYFDAPPETIVRAGDHVLARFSPAADFAETVTIPGDALAASGGLITIETSRTFRPSDSGSSPDRRVLGLRLYDVVVR